MNHLDPTVSVILATYLRLPSLKLAIESVLAQSYEDWELLVIDDGSPDDTYGVVAPFVEQDARIRYFRHKNRGYRRSRNIGISTSLGKYVTFIDNDDEYESNHLSTRMDYLQAHPEVGVVHGGLNIQGDPYVPNKHNPSEMIHLESCAVSSSFFGRKEAFLASGGFQEKAYSDSSDLLERLSQHCPVDRIKDQTYRYNRISPDSQLTARIRNLEGK
ncbi:MAG: glycosyltransferase family 2 protein [Planctomycetota bacterium]|nr:glycosyltransferase family 2 protein [Planctomycetota bacterium]